MDAYKLAFTLWASYFSLCNHIFEKEGKKVPLVYATEELSRVHSRESALPCIQSLKLSVFEGSAVTGPLHGEITCCSPSLKMLTLSLTSDWEQKHMLCARWLNGSMSTLWKRLACICQSPDLALCVYVCVHLCVACTHIHISKHFYVAFEDLLYCLLENEKN